MPTIIFMSANAFFSSSFAFFLPSPLRFKTAHCNVFKVFIQLECTGWIVATQNACQCAIFLIKHCKMQWKITNVNTFEEIKENERGWEDAMWKKCAAMDE